MATVTRAQALCAAQDAMNKLLQAAGITCGPDGKPLDQETLDKQKTIRDTLLRSAIDAVKAADAALREKIPNSDLCKRLVAEATAASDAFISAIGVNREDAIKLQKHVAIMNGQLQELLERNSAEALYKIADALVEEIVTKDVNTITQEERDAVDRAVAAYKNARGHIKGKLGELERALGPIPFKFPGVAPIDKDTAAKKAIAEAELTRLGDAAARALTTFRGTKENPDIPRDAAVA